MNTRRNGTLLTITTVLLALNLVGILLGQGESKFKRGVKASAATRCVGITFDSNGFLHRAFEDGTVQRWDWHKEPKRWVPYTQPK